MSGERFQGYSWVRQEPGPGAGAEKIHLPEQRLEETVFRLDRGDVGFEPLVIPLPDDLQDIPAPELVIGVLPRMGKSIIIAATFFGDASEIPSPGLRVDQPEFIIDAAFGSIHARTFSID
jgi:hypothetical protein